MTLRALSRLQQPRPKLVKFNRDLSTFNQAIQNLRFSVLTVLKISSFPSYHFSFLDKALRTMTGRALYDLEHGSKKIPLPTEVLRVIISANRSLRHVCRKTSTTGYGFCPYEKG